MKDRTPIFTKIERQFLLYALFVAAIAASFFSAGFKTGYDWKAYTVSLPAER
jgi:hypothetical protein